jgi:hypothetical protein
MSACHGCGTELPAQTYRGAPRKWCSDRCRKQTLYTGTCLDCGGPTGFSGRATPPERCRRCNGVRQGKARLVWTREKIIAAIHDWAAEYGESPAIADWMPCAARADGDEARARRFEDANGRYPVHMVVIGEFGSWNAAIAAAGFEPRAAHGGGGNQLRRRKVRERTAAA